MPKASLLAVVTVRVPSLTDLRNFVVPTSNCQCWIIEVRAWGCAGCALIARMVR